MVEFLLTKERHAHFINFNETYRIVEMANLVSLRSFSCVKVCFSNL